MHTRTHSHSHTHTYTYTLIHTLIHAPHICTHVHTSFLSLSHTHSLSYTLTLPGRDPTTKLASQGLTDLTYQLDTLLANGGCAPASERSAAALAAVRHALGGDAVLVSLPHDMPPEAVQEAAVGLVDRFKSLGVNVHQDLQVGGAVGDCTADCGADTGLSSVYLCVLVCV